MFDALRPRLSGLLEYQIYNEELKLIQLHQVRHQNVHRFFLLCREEIPSAHLLILEFEIDQVF